MKKILSSKKLSRQNLMKIQGSGVGGEICCAVYCGTNECAVWTEPKVQCPFLPVCI
ncbi:hypothetical protein SAMN05421800_11112 [Chryseobacterium balustinum]|uniref:Bacteriocin n=1 Tax=Chryseobacterium balustinum TaxID=246 RepID=A0AAX2IGZ3_9FLAO|nr:hypothetical protein SAMN05421800_11112 [Chryseobacterium balustinum]SQA87677.1 Uncharacterised protein [Chryseobacterium balustinum]